MEINKKSIDIYGKSEFLRHSSRTWTVDQLLYMLFEGEEGWTINSSTDLQGFLEVLGAYALKKDITDFYELILRFTLSEVFNEEYD